MTFKARNTPGVLALLLMTVVPTASAHHSQSQFDQTRMVTIEGELTDISWSNPHSLFFVRARPSQSGDALQQWEVEGPGPRGLESAGWARGTSKAGDKVTMTGHPRRDGRPELLLLTVVLADGTKIGLRPE